jgi:hypothetical protein
LLGPALDGFPVAARDFDSRRSEYRMLLGLLLVISIHGAASTGCSLVYTKGPQPEVQPPPPCTTSNASPIADTVLAAVSVGAVVAGSILYADASHNASCSFLCFSGLNQAEEYGGVGAIILGGIGTTVFTISVVNGYGRTADCRAWLEANPQYTPQPATSSSLLVPAGRCHPRGDAPLLCSSTVSWESSAVVLER